MFHFSSWSCPPFPSPFPVVTFILVMIVDISFILPSLLFIPSPSSPARLCPPWSSNTHKHYTNFKGRTPSDGVFLFICCRVLPVLLWEGKKAVWVLTDKTFMYQKGAVKINSLLNHMEYVLEKQIALSWGKCSCAALWHVENKLYLKPILLCVHTVQSEREHITQHLVCWIITSFKSLGRCLAACTLSALYQVMTSNRMIPCWSQLHLGLWI